MIRCDAPQGSPEWLRDRLALVTASRADSVLSAKTLKTGDAAVTYAYELAAQAYTGEITETFAGSFATRRGHELEPVAAARYAYERDVTLEEAGFIRHDDGEYGCSPDRLVLDDPEGPGGLEIKCPELPKYIACARWAQSVREHVEGDAKAPKGYDAANGAAPLDYTGQARINLLVTGYAWWDVAVYYPGMPMLVSRVRADATLDRAYREAIAACLATRDVALADLRAMAVAA